MRGFGAGRFAMAAPEGVSAEHHQSRDDRPENKDPAAIASDFASGKFSCDFLRHHYGFEPAENK